MFARPTVGTTYRQEFVLGEAEDAATVLALSEVVTVPFGMFCDCVETADFTPLEPDLLEHKDYAPGIGLVLETDPETGERVDDSRRLEPSSGVQRALARLGFLTALATVVALGVPGVRRRAFVRGQAVRKTTVLCLTVGTLLLGPVFAFFGGDDSPLAQSPLASSGHAAWCWLALLAAGLAAGVAAQRWRAAERVA